MMNMRSLTTLHGRTLAAAMMALIVFGVHPVSSAPDKVTDEEMTQFVRGYLKAAQGQTPDAEVAHFAKQVRYFNNGTVDQQFVAQDQRRYYKTWPERSFELLDGPTVTGSNDGATTAKFTIRYEVTAPGRRATGMTENTVSVRRIEDELKIVAMSERKVKSAAPQLQQQQPEKPRQNNAVAKSKSKPAPSLPQPVDLPPSGTEAPLNEPKPAPAGKQEQSPQKEGVVGKTGASQEAPGGSTAQSPAGPQKATPVPEAPGFVYPPSTEQTPKNMLDVRGYSPGQKVKDPRSGVIFLVP